MFARRQILRALALVALSSTALTPIALWAGPVSVATGSKDLSSHAAAPSDFAPQTPAPGAAIDFAQNHSDIAADPTVRFGRLKNGMTYVIMKNATPPGTASMRLRIGAGSMMENDSQRGLAHFIEHMAFNGSKNVPEGDMIKILQRHGLQFGPDTNAFTNFDETVYELDLPKVSEDDVDTGLFLLRETAGNLQLAPDAIDRERGVILGEERARDTPDMHEYVRWTGTAFAGQKYPIRIPIGLTDIIKSAPCERFADFYSNFYRPELATLIITGDIDPIDLEARITKKFSDWAPPSNTAIRSTNFGDYQTKGQIVDTFSETGLRDAISVSWNRSPDEHYQTNKSVQRDLLNLLRTSILNERLARQAQDEATPFAAAEVSHYSVEHTAQVTQLNVTPKPGQDQAAFTSALLTLRQFLAYGADQAELDRALSDTESGFKAALSGQKTRNTKSLAEAIVSAVDNLEVFTSPQQDWDYFEDVKPRMTLAEVNSGIAPLFSGDGPFIWHSGETLGDLDKAALAKTYQSAFAATVTKAETHVNKPWPYLEFGTASPVVKRETIDDLGVTQLTYANGLRVSIKATRFKEDEVSISVRFAGGLKSLSPAKHPPVFQAQSQGVFEGGLGKLSASDIKDSLTGKIYSVNFGLGEDATQLSGDTTRADFATQLEVLMAFTTDAAFRADSFERLKAFVPNYYTSLAASPNGVFGLKADAALHSGDPRFGIPTQEEFLKTSNAEVKSLIETQLKTAPVEITIVGDITEAEAETQIAKTFATLTARSEAIAHPTDGNSVRFPTQNLSQVYLHSGRSDQDLSFVAWPSTDFYADTQRARGLELLADVLTLRLTDLVREKLGLSYSPDAGSEASNSFDGYGYISATAEVTPEQDQTFFNAVSQIVADLKTHPITDDELLRARKPVLDRYDNNLKTNSYWNAVLPGSARDPRLLSAVRSRREQLNAVTASELQKLAITYLDMNKALRIQIKPSPEAAKPK